MDGSRSCHRWADAPTVGFLEVGKSCEAATFAEQDSQHFADCRFPSAGLGQRQMDLDLVTVAAAVLLLDYIASVNEVGNDAVSAALGDAKAGGDVTQSQTRVASDAYEYAGVVGQEAP